MEELHERLRAALNPPGVYGAIGLYLGDEHLGDERQLPHVIVAPLTATLAEPDSPRPARGQVRGTDQLTETLRLACYAPTFAAARELALLTLRAYRQVTGDARARGTIRYASEQWGGQRMVRVASLDLTLTYTLDLSGVTVAQVQTVIEHAYLITPGGTDAEIRIQ